MLQTRLTCLGQPSVTLLFLSACSSILPGNDGICGAIPGYLGAFRLNTSALGGAPMRLNATQFLPCSGMQAVLVGSSVVVMVFVAAPGQDLAAVLHVWPICPIPSLLLGRTVTECCGAALCSPSAHSHHRSLDAPSQSAAGLLYGLMGLVLSAAPRALVFANHKLKQTLHRSAGQSDRHHRAEQLGSPGAGRGAGGGPAAPAHFACTSPGTRSHGGSCAGAVPAGGRACPFHSFRSGPWAWEAARGAGAGACQRAAAVSR